MQDEINKEDVSSPRTKKSRSQKILLIIVLVIIIAIAGYAYMKYYKSPTNSASINTAPGSAAANNAANDAAIKKQVEALVSQVGKHILLPTGETPQVAEITDPALAAKDQPFYKGAQKGDKVLIYLQARKAIVYSPARDILVNVGPLIVGNQDQAAETPAATPDKTKK